MSSVAQTGTVARRPQRPGAGSWRVLAWVARLGISGIEPAYLGLGLSRATMYSHLARLARAGHLDRVRIHDGEGNAVALTRRGARTAREHGAGGVVTPWSASVRAGRHGRAVSWVAAAATLRGWEWLGPAQIRERGLLAAGGGDRSHAPDLVLEHDGALTAVEVELHRKSKDRLDAILSGYREAIDRGRLTAVSYVTEHADVRDLVRRHADAALLGHGSACRVAGGDRA